MEVSTGAVAGGGVPVYHKKDILTIAPTGSNVMITETPLNNNVLITPPPFQITAGGSGGSESSNKGGKRLCGDWSTKLKLLRYVSDNSHLKIRFVSDYSRHFGGFKTTVSMENGK